VKPLATRDALTCDVTRVSVDDRPDHAKSGVFAVFASAADDAPFVGLVTPREIARHPGRIFADLVPRNARGTISGDAGLEEALATMEAAGSTALAVIDTGGIFAGSVTRDSLSQYLLAQERSLVAELASREAQLRAILCALPDVLVCVRADGTLVDILAPDVAANEDRSNPLCGVAAPKGTRAERLEQAFPGDACAALLAAVRQTLASGIAASVSFFTKEGATLKHYEARVVRWTDESAIILSRDTTEVTALRIQAAQADRMLALGTLAAAVAHEINNPLTFVSLNLETLRETLAQADAERVAERGAALVDEMREGIHRVQAVVRDLVRVARPEETVVGPVDVRTAIESSLRLANHEIRHRARLIREFGPVPPVAASDGALNQVVLNLLVNAGHAIEDGAADRNEIRVVTRTDAEGRAVIEVHDSGRGMTESVRARVFEPFFTTKAQGEGLGLGLSLCQRIVASLGGVMEVESAPGAGTMFRVVLPPSHEAMRASSMPPASAPEMPRGRFLVVDDEELVARAVTRAIGGQQTVTCTSGQDAIDLIAAGSRFDAILCDLMMPKMPGNVFYERLLCLAPDQAKRIIFMSGGAFTEQAQSFLASMRTPFVQKPVDVAKLRALVADVAAGSRR
jgi:signal transduction histidine kinase/CheY-like chemotaxis protein/CBS domain-containing protein